ncbi:MAG: hypothetical protein HQ541_11130 [Mariniphaga sp.]|nr:hypothetical protein [Mariniphaga sp.]
MGTLTNTKWCTTNGSVVNCTTNPPVTEIADIYVLNAGDTMTGPLTMSGSSANIILGSNYLSGDGGDEGIFVDSVGKVGIKDAAPSDELSVAGTIGTNLLEISDYGYALGGFHVGDIGDPGTDNLIVDGTSELKSAILTGVSDTRVFRNLAILGVSSSPTGAIVIQTNIPQDDNTMIQLVINLYASYSEGIKNTTELIIGGYWTTEANGGFKGLGLVNTSGNKIQVRIARNSSNGKVAIILGDIGNTWPHPKVAVTKALLGYGISDTYADNWSIAITTDLSGYTNMDTVLDKTSIPATQVTAGTFGSGDYTFPGDLSVSGASTNFRNAIQAVDGSGSLIDADLLDTISSGSFLRSDTTDNYTSGTLTFNSGTELDMASSSTLDINGNLSVADTNIALDGASTNFLATGNLSINTNDLYVQKSTGNVGIGATSPKGKLHIGPAYALSFDPSTDTHGSSTIFHNAYNDGSDVYKWGYTHASFGSRGIKFKYNDGIKFYADNVATTADTVFTPTQRMVIRNDGNVGIGVTGPTYKLDVNGTGRFSGDVTLDAGKNLKFYDHNGTYPTAIGGFIWDLNNDNAKIYAQQAASDQIDFIFKIADNVGTTDRFVYWIDSYTGETDDAYPLYMDGTKVVLNYPTVFGTGTSKDMDFYLMGSGSSALSNAYIFGDAANKRVGIGTTNLDNDSVLTITGNVKINGDVDLGQYKLSAGEVDPRYEIDGVVYATYGHSTTGLKEETTGKVELRMNTNHEYQYVIDFDEAEKESDLWLFKEITVFGDDWNDLVVTLTPEGKADVWYEFIPEENKIIIYGELGTGTFGSSPQDSPLKVSYRLMAPRFDWPERDTNLYNQTGKAGEGVGIFVR